MKIHRFIGDFEIQEGFMVLEDEETIHQMREVLRLRTGEQIALCDGYGREGVGILKEYQGDRCIVHITEVRTLPEVKPKVTLYCAILKRENFELVCQKATELGVSEIVPVLTKRTVKLNIRSERLEKIIREAAEQSGRGWLPTLRETLELPEAFKEAQSHSHKLFFALGDHPKADTTGADSIGIFIGPEGGWDDSEVAEAQEYGCTLATLGSLTLRAETAAIVGVFNALQKS